MNLLKRLRRDQAGSPAVQFALAAPTLLLLVIGIIQLGLLFSAYAGMASAVNEGARFATIYPTPTDDQIIAKMNQKKFLVQDARMTVAAPVHATANGVQYVELTMTYSAPLNFVFFSTPAVTLRQTRRAYLS
ncbi:MAG TPA: TadE/TadG family type IV pilus assembly protein [Sphingomonas sp.]|nr:TadE/TadG family type IV pilus assembly protein [Sphingomonas sp.]